MALALATALLSRAPARAAALADEVADKHDLEAAWVCLAAARGRLGAVEAAGAALARALSGHRLTAAAEALARSLVGAGAAGDLWPGWCGLGADDRPTIEADGAVATLDGAPARLIDGRLPRRARDARRLDVTAGGRAPLGSPIRLDRIRRIEGFVEAADGGLRGWAWHPGDAARVATLTVADARGRARPVVADGEGPARAGPLARPRGFAVSAEVVARLTPPLRVLADGRDVTGSPLDPGLERRFVPVAAASRGGEPAVGRARPMAVIVPVHNGGDVVRQCLASVLAHRPAGVPVIVVDDVSDDAVLVADLDALAARRRIRLVRPARNLGFPGAANLGLAAAGARDAVLLNSDTLVAPDWLARLRAAAYSATDIGTVSPFSNDATILTYPRAGVPGPAPDAAGVAALAAASFRANGDAAVEVPTTVGFCMYIRADCLAQTGPFREDVFAQGYGEETDFCLRARHLGWRHVAATGAYVGHRTGVSFGAARGHLLERNLAIIERLHPGWAALVAAHAEADPLLPARARLDREVWRAGGRGRRAVAIVTHDDGGGVERVVARVCAETAASGRRPVVLRSAPGRMAWACDGARRDTPNLRWRLPAEMDALVRFLRGERVERVVFHHTLGHDPSILSLPERLGVPHDVFVHDYLWICPRVTLVGPAGRYCGEPDAATCERCVAEAGRMDDDDTPVAALRARSARVLEGAADVACPSVDAASRLRRHFPALSPRAVPHEAEPAVAPIRLRAPLVVGVPGAIGVEKGFDVILEAARDAASRDLPIRYVVVGHTPDDRTLLATGRCHVTGPYAPGEAATLLPEAGATMVFIASVWPETWCFALTEALASGLPVAAFDIGAQADRVRASGRGLVLPLGLPAGAVNDTFLRAAGV